MFNKKINPIGDTFIWNKQIYNLSMDNDQFEKNYVNLITIIERYLNNEWIIEKSMVSNGTSVLEAQFIIKLKNINVVSLGLFTEEEFLIKFADSDAKINSYSRFLDCLIWINTICDYNFLNVLKGRFYKTITDNLLGNLNSDLRVRYPTVEEWINFSKCIDYVYLLPHFQYAIAIDKSITSEYISMLRPLE